MIFLGVRNDLDLAPSHPLGRFAPMTVKEALRDCTPSEIVPLMGKNLAKMQLLRPGANAKEKERASLAVFGQVSGFTLLRIKWHAPAPTILKTVSVSPTFGAGLIMPDEDRYVSIAELKRLGSFPDEFKLEGTFEKRRARIGNSVPPLLMRAIAEHIKIEILARVDAASNARRAAGPTRSTGVRIWIQIATRKDVLRKANIMEALADRAKHRSLHGRKFLRRSSRRKSFARCVNKSGSMLWARKTMTPEN